MLDVPRTEHVTIGGHSFISTAARVWNSLPTAVQSSESLDIVRRRLKTELFERSYNRPTPRLSNDLLLRDSLSLSRSFLLWPQPWSLLTITLLCQSFLIIIIIIMCNVLLVIIHWTHFRLNDICAKFFCLQKNEKQNLFLMGRFQQQRCLICRPIVYKRRHRNKTHSWYSELNSLQTVYFGFFFLYLEN